MTNNSWIIWDEELENLLESDVDQLWTSAYVEQLFSIITNLSEYELEKWFNIWLYGWWWSGKSSIVKSLISKIKTDNTTKKKIQIVEFDCWKYSKDDLRRSVLMGMLKDKKD